MLSSSSLRMTRLLISIAVFLLIQTFVAAEAPASLALHLISNASQSIDSIIDTHNRTTSSISAPQSPPDDPCTLPKLPGPCRGLFRRWYFDPSRARCVRFVYGGCDGNENNFNSSLLCNETCGSSVHLLNQTDDTVSSCFNWTRDDPIPPSCNHEQENEESKEAKSDEDTYHRGTHLEEAAQPERIWYFNDTAGVCQTFRGCYDDAELEETGDRRGNETASPRTRFFRSGRECARECAISDWDETDETLYDDEDYAEAMRKKWMGDDEEYDEDEEEIEQWHPGRFLLSSDQKRRPCFLERANITNALDSDADGQSKAFSPNCTQYGYYEPMQCHNDTCWCVDPESGHEVNGSRNRSMEATVECGACHLAKSTTLTGRVLIGAYQPQCDERGHYKQIQCHGSTGYCWCVDSRSGDKLNRTEVRGRPDCARGNGTATSAAPGFPGTLFSEREILESLANATAKKPSLGRCALELSKVGATPAPGAFVPKCVQGGYFDSVQCHGSTGYCWCADPESGAEVPGTKTPPGRSLPNCGACHQRRLQELQKGTGSPKPIVGNYVPQCDTNGHFSTLQINPTTGYVWCVDPITGEEIPGTKKAPGTGAPMCSGPSLLMEKARNEIAGNATTIAPEVHANRSESPLDTDGCKSGGNSSNCTVGAAFDTPQDNSDFLRCNDTHCWCIDSSNQTIVDTVQSSNLTVFCNGSTISNETDAFNSDLNFPPIFPTTSYNGTDRCEAVKETGPCRGSFTKWYFDTRYRTCLAFTYGGCGGNSNKFDTRGQCTFACMKANAHPCPLDIEAELGSVNSSNTSKCATDKDCSSGFVCKNGGNQRICCNATVDALYQQALRPKCTQLGAKVVKIPNDESDSILLGESCSGMPCPLGSKCEQPDGALFAYCCRGQSSIRELPIPDRIDFGDNSTTTTNGTTVKIPEKCFLPKDAGFQPAAVAAQDRWYFDAERKQCIKFTFVPSGGNSNNFRTKDECELICKKPADQTQFNVDPTGNNNNDADQQQQPNPCAKKQTPSAQDCSTQSPSVSQTRWYFNEEKFECVAYSYNECSTGGIQDLAADGFRLKADCDVRCKPQDGPTCSGGAEPYVDPARSSVQQKNCAELTCPAGYRCTMGWLFASCCNATVEEAYETAYSNKCPNGAEAYSIKTSDRPIAFFGDSCQDLACADGFECVQVNSYFAKCCSTSASGTGGSGSEAANNSTIVSNVVDVEQSRDAPSAKADKDLTKSTRSPCPGSSTKQASPAVQLRHCSTNANCPKGLVCWRSGDQQTFPGSYCCPASDSIPVGVAQPYSSKQNCTKAQLKIIRKCERDSRMASIFDTQQMFFDSNSTSHGSNLDQCQINVNYSDCIRASFNATSPPCFDYFDHVTRNVFEQFCNSPARTRLMKNASCVEALTNSSVLHECARNLNSTLQSAEGVNDKLDYKMLCKSMEDFGRCLHEVIAANCSQHDADEVREFFENATAVIFDGLPCSDLVNRSFDDDQKRQPPLLANLISPPTVKPTSGKGDVSASTEASGGTTEEILKSCTEALKAFEEISTPKAEEHKPQCDSSGNYEEVQCNVAETQCWCVDIRNGQESIDSRINITVGNSSKPKCGASSSFSSSSSSSSSAMHLATPTSSPHCTEDILIRFRACTTSMEAIMTPFIEATTGWSPFCDPRHFDGSSSHGLTSIWHLTCDKFARFTNDDACGDIRFCDCNGVFESGHRFLNFLCRSDVIDSLGEESRIECLRKLRGDKEAGQCPTSTRWPCKSMNSSNCCRTIQSQMRCLGGPVKRECGESYWRNVLHLSTYLFNATGHRCPLVNTSSDLEDSTSIDAGPTTIEEKPTASSLLEPVPPAPSIVDEGSMDEFRNASYECARPLLEKWNAITIVKDAAELDTICTDIKAYKRCEDALSQPAGNSNSTSDDDDSCSFCRVLDGLELLFDDLCDNEETKSWLKSKLECLESAMKWPRVTECAGDRLEIGKPLNDPWTSIDSSSAISFEPQSYCRDVAKLLSCAKPAITSECGSDDFDRLLRLHDLLLTKLSPVCQLGGVHPLDGVCNRAQMDEQLQCDRDLFDGFAETGKNWPNLILSVNNPDFSKESCDALSAHRTCSAHRPCKSFVSALASESNESVCANSWTHLATGLYCISKLRLEPKSMECLDQLPIDLLSMKNSSANGTSTNASWCEAIDVFSECVGPFMEDTCGCDVGKFFDEVRERLGSSNVMCGDSSERSSTWTSDSSTSTSSTSSATTSAEVSTIEMSSSEMTSASTSSTTFESTSSFTESTTSTSTSDVTSTTTSTSSTATSTMSTESTTSSTPTSTSYSTATSHRASHPTPAALLPSFHFKSNCTDDQLQQQRNCTTSFVHQLERFIHNQSASSNSVNFDAGGSCEAYAAYRRCHSDVAAACRRSNNPTQSAVDTTVEAVFGYLCNKDGRSTFANIEKCLDDLMMDDEETSKCVDQLEGRIGTNPMLMAESSICHQIDRFLNCTRRVLTEKCGQRAWKFVSTLYRRFVLAFEPNCPSMNDKLIANISLSSKTAVIAASLSLNRIMESSDHEQAAFVDFLSFKSIEQSPSDFCASLDRFVSSNSSTGPRKCTEERMHGYRKLHSFACHGRRRRILSDSFGCLNRLNDNETTTSITILNCLGVARNSNMSDCTSGQVLMDCSMQYFHDSCGRTIGEFLHASTIEFFTGMDSRCDLRMPILVSNSTTDSVEDRSNFTCEPEDRGIALYCAANMTLVWEPMLFMRMDDASGLSSYCANYESYKACARGREECAPILVKAVDRLASSFCSDAQRNRSSSCLARSIVEVPSIRDCLSIFEATIGAPYESAICASTAGLLHCIHPPLVETCGEEAFVDLLRAHNRFLEVINHDCMFAIPILAFSSMSSGWCTMRELESLNVCDRTANDALQRLIDRRSATVDDGNPEAEWNFLAGLCQHLNIHRRCTAAYPCRTDASELLDELYRNNCTSMDSLIQRVNRCYLGVIRDERASDECSRSQPLVVAKVDDLLDRAGMENTPWITLACDELPAYFDCALRHAENSRTHCSEDTEKILRSISARFSNDGSHFRCFNPDDQQGANETILLALWRARTTLLNESSSIMDPVFTRVLNDTCLIDVISHTRSKCVEYSTMDFDRFLCERDGFFECTNREGPTICGDSRWNAMKSKLDTLASSRDFVQCNESSSKNEKNETAISEQCLTNIVRDSKILAACSDLLPEPATVVASSIMDGDMTGVLISLAVFACANAQFFHCASLVAPDVCDQHDWSTLQDQLNRLANDQSVQCGNLTVERKNIVWKQENVDGSIERESQTAVSTERQSADGILDPRITKCFVTLLTNRDLRRKCATNLPTITALPRANLDHHLGFKLNCSDLLTFLDCAQSERAWRLCDRVRGTFDALRATDPAVLLGDARMECNNTRLATAQSKEGHRGSLLIEAGFNVTKTACHTRRFEAMMTMSATNQSASYVPLCKDNGQFEALQCDLATGYCWCVDQDSGEAINGTRAGPSQTLPKCGIKQIFACAKLPWKPTCLPHNEPPQSVFRYFRDGDGCTAYKYSYCSDEAHLPPFPFKSEQDCLNFCM